MSRRGRASQRTHRRCANLRRLRSSSKRRIPPDGLAAASSVGN
jgi:hypothetical protein